MKKGKIILILGMLFTISFIFSIRWYDDQIKKDVKFSEFCFNCKNFDYSEYINKSSALYALKEKQISNIKISYSRFLSRKGSLILSLNYKLSNGKTKRMYGITKNIDVNDIKWSSFNVATISFKGDQLILNIDPDFFSSNISVFNRSLNEALLDLIKNNRIDMQI